MRFSLYLSHSLRMIRMNLYRLILIQCSSLSKFSHTLTQSRTFGLCLSYFVNSHLKITYEPNVDHMIDYRAKKLEISIDSFTHTHSSTHALRQIDFILNTLSK